MVCLSKMKQSVFRVLNVNDIIVIYCFVGVVRMNWFFGKKKNPRLKPRSPETRKEKLLKLAQSDMYYSVTLTRCGCKASSSFIGKCFQFEHAPPLPMQECTSSKCTCEYLGVINRRKAKRRENIRRTTIRFDEDRRQLRRRKEEEMWNNNDSH